MNRIYGNLHVDADPVRKTEINLAMGRALNRFDDGTRSILLRDGLRLSTMVSDTGYEAVFNAIGKTGDARVARNVSAAIQDIVKDSYSTTLVGPEMEKTRKQQVNATALENADRVMRMLDSPEGRTALGANAVKDVKEAIEHWDDDLTHVRRGSVAVVSTAA